MSIGTSKGAFYEDAHHRAAAIWDPEKYDDNEMVVTPNQMETNRQLENVEMNELGGLPVSMKQSQGNYIGDLSNEDDLSFDRTEAIGRRNDEGKVIRSADPKELMKKFPGEEGYTLPDNPHLFIRKPKPSDIKPEDLVS